MSYYMASLEALDTELGRVLEKIDRRSTTIIIVSDNGPFGLNAQSPFDPIRSKGTVYEGGVWVPLMIAGPQVVDPGRQSPHLVNVVDLFATIVELMGESQTTGVDSRSLVPILRDPAAPQVRQFNYCEQFTADPSPLDMRAIRSPTLKLVQRRGARDELFDLSLDRFERQNVIGLPTYQSAAHELQDELLALTGLSSLNASDFVQGDEASFLDEQSAGRTDSFDFETDPPKGTTPVRSRSLEAPRSGDPIANRKR
jgi:arylsulfatase A-like enzyme